MSDATEATVTCAGCDRRYRWKPTLAGKRVRCQCGETVEFPLDPPIDVGLAEEYGLADSGASEGGVADAPADGGGCPGCGAAIAPDTVVCMACGYNQNTGERFGDVTEGPAIVAGQSIQAKAGRVGVAIVVGGVAAALCGVVWAVIANVTGYEIGWLAWGVGVVTGLSVSVTAQRGSPLLGAWTAGLAVMGLVIGKLLIVQWAATSSAVIDEMVQNEDFVMAAFLWDEASKSDPELARWIIDNQDAVVMPAEIEAKLTALAPNVAGRMIAAGKEAKRDVAKAYMSELVGEVGFGERVMMTSSAFDILWVILAVASAFRIGSGLGSEE